MRKGVRSCRDSARSHLIFPSHWPQHEGLDFIRILSSIVIAIFTLIPQVDAGSIFVTGHDPVWHAQQGGNFVGARNLAQIGIEYARNTSVLPFLFVESREPAVPGNNHEAPFLISALGYNAADFVAKNAADLLALPDFRAALNSFSAIVVASDHGGMLTSAELSFLNNHAADILDYLNAGGGLFASAESNATGLIGSTTPFGFLPFLVTSVSFQATETGNTVTPFGASLGLMDGDVNGNFSHNIFTQTGGMTPVDLLVGNPINILSLATRSPITPGGVVPEPGDFILLGVGILSLGWAYVRRPNSRSA